MRVEPAAHVNPVHVRSGRWHVHGDQGHCHSISGGYAVHAHHGVPSILWAEQPYEAPEVPVVVARGSAELHFHGEDAHEHGYEGQHAHGYAKKALSPDAS